LGVPQHPEQPPDPAEIEDFRRVAVGSLPAVVYEAVEIVERLLKVHRSDCKLQRSKVQVGRGPAPFVTPGDLGYDAIILPKSTLNPTGSSLDLTRHASRAAPDVQVRFSTRLAELPWWLLVVLLAGLVLLYNFVTNELYREVFETITVGIRLTILITISAYSIALFFGLLTALGQLSRNVLARNVALLYVQVVRGIPIIVQIFVVALVVVPLLVGLLNNLGNLLAAGSLLSPDNLLSTLNVRDISFVLRGIAALAISYGAFSSEIFRAGIQSIEKGQVEAANSLGLSRIHSLRLIILPQAIRRVLPPLGNDFIAMLKESSLVSVLGVSEITQLSRKHAAATFRFPETYYSLAFLYLSMTLLLSMGVKFMERRLNPG